MGDAATDEYQSFCDNVSTDNTTGDTGKKTAQQRIAKEGVIQEFDDIHPFSRRAFFVPSIH